MQPEQRPATGKLQPRKSGMFAQTPINAAPAASLTSKRKAPAEDEIESSKIIVDGQGTGRRKSAAPVTKGSLKRPARIQNQPTVRQNSSYDVPESPTSEEWQPPPKRDRRSKASPAKKSATTAARRARPTKARPSPETRPRSKVHAKQKQEAVEDDEVPDNVEEYSKVASRRSRMKATSNTDNAEVSTKPSKGKARSRPIPADVLDKESQHPDKWSRRRKESDEDFGQSFVQLGDDNDEDATNDTGAPVESTRDKALDPAVIKKEKGRALNHSDNVIAPERPAHQTQGASQNNAIVLSDQQDSSSPAASTPRHKRLRSTAPVRSATQQAKARAPKTPTVFHSSPPLKGKQAMLRTADGLVDDTAAQRTTIISFDKSGPRNQGSLSVKKGAAGAAWRDRSSLQPGNFPPTSGTSSKAKVDLRRRNGPSSAATSVRSHRTTRPAPPSNVAEDVSDALAGFMKQPQQKFEQLDPRLQPAAITRSGPRARMQSEQPVEDEGFAFVDDFDGPTLVDAPTEQKLASRHDARTAARPTDAQIAMPSPVSKLQHPHRAPTVPAMLPSNESVAPQKVTTNVSATQSGKRVRNQQCDNEEPSKRPRVSTSAEAVQVGAQEEGRNVGLSQAQRKPELLQRHAKQVPEPIKRSSRQPRRHTSQGSQKVDIHGSPVPDGMIVPEQATVLETFSQQAGLSPDAVLGETMVSRKIPTADKVDPTARPQFFMPPSRQPNVQSSNRKTVPGGPHEESQALTAVIRIDARRPLLEDQRGLPSTDPFTSSEEHRKQPSDGSSSSNFMEQLTKMTAKAQQQIKTASNIQISDEDPDMTLVEPVPPKRGAKRVPSLSTVSSSGVSEETNDSSSTISDLRTWRSGLKPHQMIVFDELVNISHRLVSNLVDNETAVTDIVEDYRRRGSNLVEQMHLSHARQYQKYVDTLKERKKRLRKDLTDCSRKLKENVVAVKKDRKGRAESSSEHIAVEEKLQSFMRDYC